MADSTEKVIVKQIRGVRGRTNRTRATLEAMGLGRIGKQKELPANPAVIGMIKKVRHLVEVETVK